MRFWIALIHPRDGRPVPLVEEGNEFDDKVALFSSYEEAERAAEKHPAGIAWGYEILDWPHRSSE